MTKKLKRILTDANVIIDAHEKGYWELLCNTYRILIPASILENEVFYFEADRGKIGMNPTAWLKNGKVTRLEASLEDFQQLERRLNPDFISSLDPGELEALALLMSKDHRDTLFTTGDRAAVKALGVLGLGTKGTSVEELLIECGHRNKHKLPVHFTKKWLHRALSEGFMEQQLWLKK